MSNISSKLSPRVALCALALGMVLSGCGDDQQSAAEKTTLEKAEDTVKDSAAAVSESADKAMEATQEAASSAAEGAKEMGQAAMEKAGDAAEATREAVDDPKK